MTFDPSKDCWDCAGYSRIKQKCVADNGHPDGSDYACENFKDRFDLPLNGGKESVKI